VHSQLTSDGISRLYAYQTVGDLPLVVSVGLAESDVLAPWWSKVRVLGLVYALMAASGSSSGCLYPNCGSAGQGERTEALRARHDVLTGLANRLGFEEALDREWRRAARDRSALCL